MCNMKKLFLISLALVAMISCRSSKNHYFQLTTGQWISKKQYEKTIRDCIDSAWRSLSEEERLLLSDTGYSVKIEFDTISKITD